MPLLFQLFGKSVNLRTTLSNDIDNYIRWNDLSLKYNQFDAPWFNEDISAIVIHRREYINKELIPPYKHLEVVTRKHVHIGWVCVYYDKKDPHMTEIGIDLPEESYWGKGLGTEALTLWINYLFDEFKLTRIGFFTWDGNTAVKVIGNKLGFVEECRIRKGCVVKGEFYDRIKMGILKEEWEALNHCI